MRVFWHGFLGNVIECEFLWLFVKRVFLRAMSFCVCDCTIARYCTCAFCRLQLFKLFEQVSCVYSFPWDNRTNVLCPVLPLCDVYRDTGMPVFMVFRYTGRASGAGVASPPTSHQIPNINNHPSSLYFYRRLFWKSQLSI